MTATVTPIESDLTEVLRALVRQPVEASAFEVWLGCQHVGSLSTVQALLNQLRVTGLAEEVHSPDSYGPWWVATERGRRAVL